MDYTEVCKEIIDCAEIFLSDIKPSDWNEEHRVMTSDVSPFPGRFSYNKTPYLREVVDLMAEDHPAKTIAVMKGAQIGFSTGVIEAAIGWIISENPAPILFLTGHTELAEEAMSGKIDQMINSCGLRHLIRPNVLRARNQRTGDTNKSKEFPGGSLTSGGAGNHKLLRQRSIRYMFIDDFDGVKSFTKESGSTTTMIEQRLAAYFSKMKLFYISTPELKEVSNIEPVYLKGDQRRYHVPCPCCGELIALYWEVDIEGSKDKAGITWELDKDNKIIKGSVGYICQLCNEFFTDEHKYEINLAGEWRATATASRDGYYSYHISSLYAPPGMYDWNYYVQMYLEACPPGQDRDEEAYKTFRNLCLGETYEITGESPKASKLQENIRGYEIGMIPDRVSMNDGNGQIVLLTCSCDLNGKDEDARLDWEILAWSETGSSYSVQHGSIGTFVPREGSKKIKADREHWTYVHNRERSVWPQFQKILDATYICDTGRKMAIMISGVDTGHFTKYAYEFIDRTNSYCVGLKGDKEKKIPLGRDAPTFKRARERDKLYLVEINPIKDGLAKAIALKWDPDNDEKQPHGFMNYPTPSEGLYLLMNYFSHYESEKRVVEKKAGAKLNSRWVKVSSVAQNHFWDVRVYNVVLKDIITAQICKEYKLPNGGWAEFVQIVLDGQ